MTQSLIETLIDLETMTEVQISHDGTQVIYVQWKTFRADKDATFEKTIYIADAATGQARPLTGSKTGTNDQPRWSPDGSKIAFISNRVDHSEMQLYLLDLSGGEARALTDLRGKVSEPKWSADGKSIAFLYDGTLDPQKYVEADPVVVDVGTRFHRVWMLDLETRELRSITPENGQVFEYDWSPEGKTLAILYSTHPNPDESWYSAQVYTVDVTSGTMNHLVTMPNQIGRLTFAPDSQSLAFVTGVLSDQGNVSGEVYIVLTAGGEPKCLTPGIDYSITYIQWRDEGIVYGGRQIEGAVVGLLDPDSGEERLLAKGMFTINGYGAQKVSVSKNRRYVGVHESFNEPPNVYLGSLDQPGWNPLTKAQGALDPLHVDNVYWQGRDGQPIHGYLVYPPGYTPGKRYPLFAHVHGGPSWSYVPRYGSLWERVLITLGCVVFMPNPRGSWGRGSAFQSANVGDLGGGDWQDINAGVDYLVNTGLADPDHMAVGGWSYGGYLTTWIVTQTDRFRCAVAGAPITSYESNYGVVPNREWQTTMFGSNVYDDYDLHRSRSPMAFVNRVKTPTLLVHGERDIDAPVQQSIEFYTALKHFGVPTQLIIYPREPHHSQERAHEIDLYQRIHAWVDHYLFA